MALTVIGLMSGTSYDAIDAAVGRFEHDGHGNLYLEPLGFLSTPVPEPLRARISALLPPAATTVAEVCRLDTELGQEFGRAAHIADQQLAAGAADLVCSHGQTVYHWVEETRARGTLQLGNPAWIASGSGIGVISDLRSADIALGGQGAPLAPILDRLLLLADGVARGALNLGGIANITVRDAAGSVLAYDIGPASALIDRAVVEISRGQERMDTDGRRAARGRVDGDLLELLLAEPYYALAPPKSTGKELFHAYYVRDLVGDRQVAPDDMVATLTELTAVLVARSCRAHGLAELVVSGGGWRNPTLMTRITQLAEGVTVRSLDAWGISGESKEAYLFALLGYLWSQGLAGNVPSATGAARASVLGSFTPGPRPLPAGPASPPVIDRLTVTA